MMTLNDEQVVIHVYCWEAGDLPLSFVYTKELVLVTYHYPAEQCESSLHRSLLTMATSGRMQQTYLLNQIAYRC